MGRLGSAFVATESDDEYEVDEEDGVLEGDEEGGKSGLRDPDDAADVTASMAGLRYVSPKSSSIFLSFC